MLRAKYPHTPYPLRLAVTAYYHVVRISERPSRRVNALKITILQTIFPKVCSKSTQTKEKRYAIFSYEILSYCSKHFHPITFILFCLWCLLLLVLKCCHVAPGCLCLCCCEGSQRSEHAQAKRSKNMLHNI